MIGCWDDCLIGCRGDCSTGCQGDSSTCCRGDCSTGCWGICLTGCRGDRSTVCWSDCSTGRWGDCSTVCRGNCSTGCWRDSSTGCLGDYSTSHRGDCLTGCQGDSLTGGWCDCSTGYWGDCWTGYWDINLWSRGFSNWYGGSSAGILVASLWGCSDIGINSIILELISPPCSIVSEPLLIWFGILTVASWYITNLASVVLHPPVTSHQLVFLLQWFLGVRYICYCFDQSFSLLVVNT